MLVASEIGDISRFRTAGKLVSCCGLCPTVHQSGKSMYMGSGLDPFEMRTPCNGDFFTPIIKGIGGHTDAGC